MRVRRDVYVQSDHMQRVTREAMLSHDSQSQLVTARFDACVLIRFCKNRPCLERRA